MLFLQHLKHGFDYLQSRLHSNLLLLLVCFFCTGPLTQTEYGIYMQLKMSLKF